MIGGCENAWAAGLFEGEGWLGLSRVGGGAYPFVALSMIDEDVVRRFHRAMGVGTVIQEKARGRARQPAWRWKAANRPDFATAVSLLEPWLSPRRLAQLEEVRRGMTPVKITSGRRIAA